MELLRLRLNALVSTKTIYMTMRNKEGLIPSLFFFGSSVKCVDTFRIALTEKQSYELNKNFAKTVNYLSYSHPLTLKIISF